MMDLHSEPAQISIIHGRLYRLSGKKENMIRIGKLEKLCSAILFINSFIPSTSFMRSALMKLLYAISEFPPNKSSKEKDLAQTVANAHSQIDEKLYDAKLIADGFSPILFISFSNHVYNPPFCESHQCVMKKED